MLHPAAIAAFRVAVGAACALLVGMFLWFLRPYPDQDCSSPPPANTVIGLVLAKHGGLVDVRVDVVEQVVGPAAAVGDTITIDFGARARYLREGSAYRIPYETRGGVPSGWVRTWGETCSSLWSTEHADGSPIDTAIRIAGVRWQLATIGGLVVVFTAWAHVLHTIERRRRRRHEAERQALRSTWT